MAKKRAPEISSHLRRLKEHFRNVEGKEPFAVRHELFLGLGDWFLAFHWTIRLMNHPVEMLAVLGTVHYCFAKRAFLHGLRRGFVLAECARLFHRWCLNKRVP